MRIQLRFDSSNQQHTHMTLFINGQNAGKLCCTPAESIWLNHILLAGAKALSPGHKKPIEYVSSGKAPDPAPAEIDAVVQ